MTSLVVVVTLALATQQAQPPERPAPPSAVAAAEAARAAEAWIALANRNVAEAEEQLRRLQTEFPNSSQILALAVEVDLMRRNAESALASYERWRSGRDFEDPSVLRRIAQAVLREIAADPSHIRRLEALRALADDGDREAAASMLEAAQKGSVADIAALAAAGHPQAIDRVAEALTRPVPNKIALVEALAEGGATSAIPAIASMLDEPRPEHRAAAASALGRLGARDHVERLRQILKQPDEPPYVRLAAAAGLYQLGDSSGLAQLQNWLRSPVPAMRLAAAEALVARQDARPDGEWMSTVRELQQADDPAVRLGAAKLLAPHDPATARATMQQLASSGDILLAATAAAELADVVDGNLSELRALLARPDARLAAARRILELTR